MDTGRVTNRKETGFLPSIPNSWDSWGWGFSRNTDNKHSTKRSIGYSETHSASLSSITPIAFKALHDAKDDAIRVLLPLPVPITVPSTMAFISNRSRDGVILSFPSLECLFSLLSNVSFFLCWIQYRSSACFISNLVNRVMGSERSIFSSVMRRKSYSSF